MVKEMEIKRGVEFPHTVVIDGLSITIRLMTQEDRETLIEFGHQLSEEDRVFMRMDITRPEAIDEWMNNLLSERTRTVVAVTEKDGIVGYASLHQNKVLWTRHLGEIRLFLKRELRQIGLGRVLAEIILGLARDNDVQIVEVNIPRIQPDLQKILQTMGFMPEAMLANWLIDPDGNTHDMIIMSYRFNENV